MDFKNETAGNKTEREGFTREVARRVFAQELRDSNLSFKDGNDQYSPQYLITPTGARCNRVFIVGTLTEKENIGQEAEYWRARIIDPTGTFYIFAGQYQPEALQTLVQTNAPEFVAVVGKTSSFTSNEGNTLISIRPESIQVVDAATRENWVLDTARLTLERLKMLDSSDPDSTLAKQHYTTDIKKYKNMVITALQSLRSGK